jgi:hypothetical protein
MPQRRPIETAPKDGRKVRVLWTDPNGQVSETIARYHALDRLRRAGGDWDQSDVGWWIFVDGRTQVRIEPTGWIAGDEDEEE